MPNSHASAVRRLIDFMPGKNIYQFGIRSERKTSLNMQKKHTNMYTIDVFEPLSRVLDDIKDKPIYITLTSTW